MKATQLIETLRRMVELHGDADVLTPEGPGAVIDVESIEDINDGGKVAFVLVEGWR